MLDTKITHALSIIREPLLQARAPIVLCSFGKDSIVLLHLCLRLRKVPVMFFRFAKFHEKHAHALSVMQEWDLEVYDMWPAFAEYYQSGTFFEVFHSYPTGPRDFIKLFSGIRARRDGESRYLCAVDDLLHRPTVTGMTYPWDVTFLGHKGVDDLEIGKQVVITQPISPLGNTTLVTPFTDWTDQDIWDYIRRYDLPYDRARYDQQDESVSPDKYPTCFRCLDTQYRGASVLCPKTNLQIPSQARSPEQHEATRQSLIQQAHYCEVIGAPRTTPNTAHL